MRYVSSSTLALWNDTAELVRLESFISGYCEQHGISPSIAMELNLVAEECFVNVVEHGFDDQARHQIQVALELVTDVVTITVEDEGVAFDPLSAPEFDPKTPIEQRRVGGLGIHLVRNLMDEVKYQRTDGKNRLTMRKSLLQAAD